MNEVKPFRLEEVRLLRKSGYRSADDISVMLQNTIGAGSSLTLHRIATEGGFAERPGVEVFSLTPKKRTTLFPVDVQIAILEELISRKAFQEHRTRVTELIKSRLVRREE